MDDELRAWVEGALDVPEITAWRSRPWADIWRVDVADGRWWLKVNKAGTVHESALLRLLADRPHPLVPVSITHPDRPWTLVADAGLSIREQFPRLDRATLVTFWCDLLADYGDLQRSLTATELLAVGVPDFRTPVLPSRFAELSAQSAWFVPPATELAADRRSAVERLGPQIEAAVELLAASGTGVLDTLQHDDLHDNNVLVLPGADPRAGRRVIDWGDSSVSHPFATLRLALDSLAEQLAELPGDTDPAIGLSRVRSAYLEGWRTGGVTEAELVAEAGLVRWLECLIRAACWVRALGGRPTGPDAGAPAGWLVRMVDESPGALDRTGRSATP